MNKVAMVGWLALSTSACIAYPQSNKPVNEIPKSVITQAQKMAYRDDQGNDIKILGVAQVEPENIQCWDTQGNPAPQLVARVATICQTFSLEIEIRQHKKTRFLIVESMKDLSEYGVLEESSEAQMRFVRVWKTHVPGLLRVDSDKSAATTNLRLRIFKRVHKRAFIECKPGQYVAFGDRRLEFVKSDIYSEPKNDQLARYKDTPLWNLIISDASSILDANYFTYRLLDKDRTLISYVDRHSKPADIIRAMNNDGVGYGLSGTASGSGNLDNYAKTLAVLKRNANNLFSIVTNVDPNLVGYIVMDWDIQNNEKDILFKDIPLEPKK